MANKRKQNKNNCWVGVTLIIITILVVGGILYYKMPKQVCHDEIRTQIVETGHYEYINEPGMVNIEVNENVEYLCETGVSVDDFRTINSMWFTGMDKKCIVKHIDKVCEVVYK